MPPILPAPSTATWTLGNCAGVVLASTAISVIVFLVLDQSGGATHRILARKPSAAFQPSCFDVRPAAMSLFRTGAILARDPRIDALIQHIQGERSGIDHLVVEGADVE